MLEFLDILEGIFDVIDGVSDVVGSTAEIASVVKDKKNNSIKNEKSNALKKIKNDKTSVLNSILYLESLDSVRLPELFSIISENWYSLFIAYLLELYRNEIVTFSEDLNYIFFYKDISKYSCLGSGYARTFNILFDCYSEALNRNQNVFEDNSYYILHISCLFSNLCRHKDSEKLYCLKARSSSLNYLATSDKKVNESLAVIYYGLKEIIDKNLKLEDLLHNKDNIYYTYMVMSYLCNWDTVVYNKPVFWNLSMFESKFSSGWFYATYKHIGVSNLILVFCNLQYTMWNSERNRVVV